MNANNNVNTLVFLLGTGKVNSLPLEAVIAAIRLGLVVSCGGEVKLTIAGRDMFYALAY